MKKIIAILLSLLLLFTIVVPAFAESENDSFVDIPIINVIGKGYQIKNADGSNAFSPNSIDRGAYIKSQLEPVLKELPAAFITGNYDKYIDALVDAVAPLYKDWVLDSNGSTAESGSYIDWDYATAPINDKKSNYQLYDYVFNYDWRLSPLEIADQLDCYIERVCAATGAEKVNIYGRCLGSNIVTAYLTKACNGAYDHSLRVKNLLFNTPPIAGYIMVGSLLSGSIKFDPDSIEQFSDYYFAENDVFEDPLMEIITTTMISVFNYAKVLGWGTKKAEAFVYTILDKALPKIALSSYGSFPSYWSMISDKFFDKAVDTIFNTDELKAEYSVFIDKVIEYHELVSKKDENGLTGYEKLFDSLKEQGVNIAVYAKYGYVCFPLFEDSNITGDVRGTATELSLGANALAVGSRFSNKYLEEAEANGTSKYISPDYSIDASTCISPDQTWFEKVEHTIFPSEMDYLTLCYFRSNGKLTVEDSIEMGFARYMELDENGHLVPAASEERPSFIGFSDKGIAVLLKVINMAIKIIKRLLGV